MLKVAVITAGVQPVPASRGGAVETLIEYLLLENEKNKYINFDVYSIYDTDAVLMSKGYHFAHFHFVRINKLLDKILKLVYRLINKILNTSGSNKFYINNIIKQLKKEQYDYILIENRTEFVLPISKKIDSKILLHLHNSYLSLSDRKSREIALSCHKILTVSQFIKNQVIKVANDLENKTLIFKNCTDINKFSKNKYLEFRNHYREANKISSDDIVIIYCGRIHETKGLKELLLAFKKLNNFNVKLLIVGSSWYGTNNCTKYVNDIKNISKCIQDKIIFTGYINFNDIPKYYASSDIAVIPSIWDDPAPLVVFESLATGLPLITTNSGGIPEYTSQSTIIINRDDNLINNLYIEIEKLIKNPSKRNQMGIESREHALKFNIDQYYMDFLDILGTKNEE